MRIGLISDTHGLMRPEALRFLAGSPAARARRFKLPVTAAELLWRTSGGFDARIQALL